MNLIKPPFKQLQGETLIEEMLRAKDNDVFVLSDGVFAVIKKIVTPSVCQHNSFKTVIVERTNAEGSVSHKEIKMCSTCRQELSP